MIRFALALLGTLVVVPAAGAADRRVTMPATFFSPARAIAVVGDTVTWANLDFTKNHTVNFADGMFYSGELSRNQTATRAFPAVGSYLYRCTLHPTMQGRVAVFDLWLGGPPQPVPFGRTAVLKALAPGGTAQVTLERRQGNGSFLNVGSPQVPRADGSVSFVLPAALPGDYRATGSGPPSGLVKLAVRARVALSVRKTGVQTFRFRASVKPVLDKAPVALQRKVRFSWKTIAKKKLDVRSSARFAIESKTPQRFRVVMTRNAGGFSKGTSRSLRVGG